MNPRPYPPGAGVRLAALYGLVSGRARAHSCALAGVLGMVAMVYLPGLAGPFVFDDFPNFVGNPGAAMQSLDWTAMRDAALSNHSGPLGRPMAALSFGLNHWAAGGFVPLPFKLTNLAIHLLAVALAWLLVLRLAQAGALGLTAARHCAVVALGAALFWGLHPINITSVLYVVQRMTSLAGICTLAGLLVWLSGRLRLGTGRPGAVMRMGGGLVVGTATGLLAKENAILLPLYAAAIEYGLLGENRSALRALVRRRLHLSWALLLGIPALAGAVALALNPGLVLDGYGGRAFTLGERLLTETRVLWFYVGLVLVPDLRRFGLYHDDIALSTGLFTPWTTPLAILGWVLAAVLAWRLRRRTPLPLFALLWFGAGHALESTVIPLEIAHEHRNYLPALGLLLAAVTGMAALPLRRWLRVGLGGAVLVVVGLTTTVRAHTWRSDATIIESLGRNHPNSAAGQQMMGELALKRWGDPATAAIYYARASALAPHETSYPMRLLMLRATHSKHPPEPADLSAVDTALAQRPITGATLFYLRTLADCVADQPECRDYAPLTARWINAARNATAGGQRRKALTVDLARVYLATDRFSDGARLMHEALMRDPDDGTYQTLAANFALLQGELDTASALLNAAARAAPWPGSGGHIATLRAAVAKRRAAAAGTP